MAYTDRFPELREFLKDVDQRINTILRPPEETLIDDLALQNLLHLSKRQTAYMRQRRQIAYHKVGGKIQYYLSDVFACVNKYRVEAISNISKFQA